MEEERTNSRGQVPEQEEGRKRGPEQDENRMNGQEWEEGRRESEERKRLTGFMGAKVIAFFLLAASFVAGSMLAALCISCGEEGIFTKDLNDVLLENLQGKCTEAVASAAGFLSRGDLEGAEEVCRGKNIGISMYDSGMEEDSSVLWSTWNGRDTELTLDVFKNFFHTDESFTLNGHVLEPGRTYLFRVYLDEAFPMEDEFRKIAVLVTGIYENRFTIIGLTAGSFFVFMACFVFLLSSAGHRNGRRGIVPGVLTGIHLDVLTAVWGAAAYCLLAVTGETARYGSEMKRFLVILIGGTALVILVTFYLMELALRMKMGNCLRHTLIYGFIQGSAKVAAILFRVSVSAVRKIPTVALTFLGYTGICILELIIMTGVRRRQQIFVLWTVEKVVLLGVVLYIALLCKKFLTAGRALAEGQEDYAMDTSKMFGDFREHGENLNSIGVGIARAVEARMKSERLKTELITNVSHDIKTPLTSIINYADLIYGEAASITTGVKTDRESGVSDNFSEVESFGGEGGMGVDFREKNSGNSGAGGRIAEYAEVLLRQSRRLKKLLEDLVEASKATTGNLEVNLVPCQAGVILTQAVGEYQNRMEEKGLELIARQPRETVMILADGRHLWRVFDNLLNNICKYAQEHSRVYLSVEEREGRVLVVFRNMSKYPLELSGEELEERFVRGDRSRHMEGNGLGLSIAKSLVELQGGTMEIVTDGDLFKVILSFAAYREV